MIDSPLLPLTDRIASLIILDQRREAGIVSELVLSADFGGEDSRWRELETFDCCDNDDCYDEVEAPPDPESDTAGEPQVFTELTGPSLAGRHRGLGLYQPLVPAKLDAEVNAWIAWFAREAGSGCMDWDAFWTEGEVLTRRLQLALGGRCTVRLERIVPPQTAGR